MYMRENTTDMKFEGGYTINALASDSDDAWENYSEEEEVEMEEPKGREELCMCNFAQQFLAALVLLVLLGFWCEFKVSTIEATLLAIWWIKIEAN